VSDAALKQKKSSCLS